MLNLCRPHYNRVCYLVKKSNRFEEPITKTTVCLRGDYPRHSLFYHHAVMGLDGQLSVLNEPARLCEDRRMTIIRCRRCKSTMIARSHRRNFLESLLRFACIRPYSCTKCGRRFWGLRR